MRRIASWTQPILKSFSFPVYSFTTGEETNKKIELNPQVFSVPLRTDFVHNVFHYYRMLGKVTTHRTKRRKDMNASKKKIRPQKGSGRARAGFRLAPRMKGGVKAHGPVPRDFSLKMNKKVVIQALKVTLAAKLADQTIVIVEDYPSQLNKTKDLAKAISFFGTDCLLVHSEEFTSNFLLASRNITQLKKINIKEVNVRNLILAKKILITVDGILGLQKNLIENENKLYMNRKLYRKLKEENKKLEPIEPVIIKTRVLKEIVKKYDLDIPTNN
jgi:large subunit ribosomal protein L4